MGGIYNPREIIQWGFLFVVVFLVILAMLKRYVPLLCLILFFGCKEGVPIYFRSPQPRGGKLFHGDIDQFLISNIPEKVHSHGNRYNELNDILFESLNDTLTSIEIDRYKNIAKVKLEFFNGLSWIEEFDLSDSSFFADSEEIELEDVILVKENIICFNKKNDKGYFEITKESNIFLLVIFAAILHAIWNGMVKNFGDKVISVSAIVFGHVPIAIVVMIFLPLPTLESVPYIILSAIIHQGCLLYTSDAADE